MPGSPDGASTPLFFRIEAAWVQSVNLAEVNNLGKMARPAKGKRLQYCNIEVFRGAEAMMPTA